MFYQLLRGYDPELSTLTHKIIKAILASFPPLLHPPCHSVRPAGKDEMAPGLLAHGLAPLHCLCVSQQAPVPNLALGVLGAQSWWMGRRNHPWRKQLCDGRGGKRAEG